MERDPRTGYALHKVERFGLQRKIVANMTQESWDSIPHAAGIVEPDITDLLRILEENKKSDAWKGISLNTVMLYAVTQALLYCPALNAHITFRRGLVFGEIKQFKEVHISMPTGLPDGKIMTINVHNCQDMTLRDLQDYISDMRRRLSNTNLDDALYEVAFADTMTKLKKGKVLKVVGRLLGTKIGNGPINKLEGEEARQYKALPPTERIVGKDIEQGTFLMSNIGSGAGSGVAGNTYSFITMMEIVPPMVACMGISAIVRRPGVVTKPDGTEVIEPRSYLPICTATDHRAADLPEIIPFQKRLLGIFDNPEQITAWINKKAGDTAAEFLAAEHEKP
ncbi:MAG: 2-oxo acid dehydrogenase subunit E2 [Oscillospiraceae bacterium]|jgi:pyruvate/2-oxoglutarate dehydrogenase complex dihydrolipoamide acyltransferase (E2) component|nr:2-oxo acid dehydrogenase subunit E2 [Oscillospiraceae bacterium]